jgi:hypothetical protein
MDSNEKRKDLKQERSFKTKEIKPINVSNKTFESMVRIGTRIFGERSKQ